MRIRRAALAVLALGITAPLRERRMVHPYRRFMYAQPWKRFGHDRLYVNIDDETSIGYWDRKTDELHPTSAKHTETLATFIADWKQQNAALTTAQ